MSVFQIWIDTYDESTTRNNGPVRVSVLCANGASYLELARILKRYAMEPEGEAPEPAPLKEETETQSRVLDKQVARVLARTNHRLQVHVPNSVPMRGPVVEALVRAVLHEVIWGAE